MQLLDACPEFKSMLFGADTRERMQACCAAVRAQGPQAHSRHEWSRALARVWTRAVKSCCLFVLGIENKGTVRSAVRFSILNTFLGGMFWLEPQPSLVLVRKNMCVDDVLGRFACRAAVKELKHCAAESWRKPPETTRLPHPQEKAKSHPHMYARETG